ncbi:hypothetical protein DFH07DRAFT_777930 [Mycena maculata]|uniref:Uncharacterized protein n=1 Tax=Mycena maculata TaxID=230809 RepID=A0AAD7N1U2_9AGAR|nr:hypothetical protein DFH07DRAFT_777930 [Mycena maculata]
MPESAEVLVAQALCQMLVQQTAPMRTPNLSTNLSTEDEDKDEWEVDSAYRRSLNQWNSYVSSLPNQLDGQVSPVHPSLQQIHKAQSDPEDSDEEDDDPKDDDHQVDAVPHLQNVPNFPFPMLIKVPPITSVHGLRELRLGSWGGGQRFGPLLNAECGRHSVVVLGIEYERLTPGGFLLPELVGHTPGLEVQLVPGYWTISQCLRGPPPETYTVRYILGLRLWITTYQSSPLPVGKAVSRDAGVWGVPASQTMGGAPSPIPNTVESCAIHRSASVDTTVKDNIPQMSVTRREAAPVARARWSTWASSASSSAREALVGG